MSSWAGVLWELSIVVSNLALIVRRRYVSGGIPASAHRLADGLVRNAPVVVRMAVFWIELRSLSCAGVASP